MIIISMLHENNEFYLKESDLSALSFRVCRFNLGRSILINRKNRKFKQNSSRLRSNLRRTAEEQTPR